MSNTNGQVSFVKSMNGILSFNTGSGTIISGDTVSTSIVACDELDCPQINVDKIESYTVGANVSLYTELIGGSVHLANGATTLFIDAPTTIVTTNVTNLNATNVNTNNIKFLTYGTNSNLFTTDNGATIQMGNAANQLVIYSPTNIAGGLKTQTIISPNPTITSSLFTNNNTGNIDIGTGLTTGILTIGGTGAVNINGSSVGITTLKATTLNTNTITASNSSSNAVIYNNITTGTVQLANNASLVEIGTNATTLSLGYNSRVDVGNLTIKNSEIRTIDSASTLTIGGPNMATTQIIAVGTSQENVYLGAVTATAKVFVGDFKFTNDTMNLMVGSVPNVAGTMTIANALTTGSLQLATGLTTGSVTIGNNAMTGNINIRTTGSLLMGNSASSIELGTGASVTNNINLGNNLTTINALGSTINIGTTTTTGPINIGTSITNGNILIGNHSTVGATGNLILRAKNGIDIGSAATSVSVGIGAPTINIGTSIISGTANINIGTTAFTTLNLNSPINPNYDSKYAVTATSGGAPTGCIGNYIFADIVSGATVLSSTFNNIVARFIDVPIGVWLLYWNLELSCPTTLAVITQILMLMGTTLGGGQILNSNIEVANNTMAVGRTRMYHITQIYTQTNATTDVYFTVTATFTGTLTQNAFTIKDCKALRIA